MKRRSSIKSLFWGLLSGSLLAPRVTHAAVYLSVGQAQQSIFGGAGMSKKDITLTAEQVRAIQAAAGTRVRNTRLQAWKVSNGGWFIVDQVIGKHENIDIAVGLGSDGRVRGMEILVYRESYGHEVRDARWRSQFSGKGPGTKLRLGKDIKNISGATLSCDHITTAVNRLTQTWQVALRHL